MDNISNLLVYSSRYKVLVILITFILSLSLLMATVSTYLQDLDVYARCPNGDCEKVVKSSAKLPRCPNGYHRSPDGDCELVTGSISSDSFSSSSSDSTLNQNSIF